MRRSVRPAEDRLQLGMDEERQRAEGAEAVPEVAQIFLHSRCALSIRVGLRLSAK
jgi:hypothetical protein